MFQTRFQFPQSSSLTVQASCEALQSPVSTQGSINSSTYIQENFQEKANKFFQTQSLGEIVDQESIQDIQNQIFEWFSERNICLGNPEDLVHKYNQEQKRKIHEKPVWVNSRKIQSIQTSEQLQVQSNSLLLRRRQKLKIQCS